MRLLKRFRRRSTGWTSNARRVCGGARRRRRCVAALSSLRSHDGRRRRLHCRRRRRAAAAADNDRIGVRRDTITHHTVYARLCRLTSSYDVSTVRIPAAFIRGRHPRQRLPTTITNAFVLRCSLVTSYASCFVTMHPKT